MCLADFRRTVPRGRSQRSPAWFRTCLGKDTSVIADQYQAVDVKGVSGIGMGRPRAISMTRIRLLLLIVVAVAAAAAAAAAFGSHIEIQDALCRLFMNVIRLGQSGGTPDQLVHESLHGKGF